VPFIGWEGLLLMAMVDLQCISFRVEGEPRDEMPDERGGDVTCVSEGEGR
jgi:hypothetical protein